MANYVNAPADEERNPSEKRGICRSGRSNVHWVVGVSFGLLCVIQSALNVYLRLERSGFCNTSDHIYPANVTLISPPDISALLLEKDQLANENRELQANVDILIRNSETLHDRLHQQQNQTMQLQNQYDKLIITLSTLERPCENCPPGWGTYMSSCYQVSKERKSWDNARGDCVSKGAHLVTLNNDVEEGVLRLFRGIDVWIGLRRRSNMWKWVDGSTLRYPNRISLPSETLRPYCVLAVQYWFESWVGTDCGEPHFWVCEKELK